MSNVIRSDSQKMSNVIPHKILYALLLRSLKEEEKDVLPHGRWRCTVATRNVILRIVVWF